MLEVADIVRLHGAVYREQPGVSLSSVQKRALRDIAACRTPLFGGHVHQCDHGQLMKAAADALRKLANDPRFLGARFGALAVLHTWTRAMLLHPHVHMLVTAGGLSADRSWVDSKHPRFLVPVEALSVIFRAKCCAGLRKAELLGDVPPSLWKKNWVVPCEHAGRGEKVLDYLDRYVFRIAIANSRLESFDNGQVGFRYRDNRTQQIRHVTLPAHEFHLVQTLPPQRGHSP